MFSDLLGRMLNLKLKTWTYFILEIISVKRIGLSGVHAQALKSAISPGHTEALRTTHILL